MPSARTIKTRNGKYYKSNAESIRSSGPLVSNIRLVQSAKGEPLVSNLGLIQTPKGEPLISNNYYYSSNSESSNIIIILGETRLSHSLAKPDCYARTLAVTVGTTAVERALIAHPTSGETQNETFNCSCPNCYCERNNLASRDKLPQVYAGLSTVIVYVCAQKRAKYERKLDVNKIPFPQ